MRSGRWGAANPVWKGNAATDQSGRDRAQRRYPVVQPCEVCGVLRAGRGHAGNVRHHRDADRLNNDPANIQWLCGKHHMAAHRSLDGRIGGGPRPRITAAQKAAGATRAALVRQLLSSGLSARDTAVVVGVHHKSIDRYLRKYQAA